MKSVSMMAEWSLQSVRVPATEDVLQTTTFSTPACHGWAFVLPEWSEATRTLPLSTALPGRNDINPLTVSCTTANCQDSSKINSTCCYIYVLFMYRCIAWYESSGQLALTKNCFSSQGVQRWMKKALMPVCAFSLVEISALNVSQCYDAVGLVTGTTSGK